jgi:hypothetical protein
MGNGKSRKLLLCGLFLVCSVFSAAAEKDSIHALREYHFYFGGINDLYTVANLGFNGYAALTDAYYLKIAEQIPDKTEGICAAVWQTWWSFMLTIWPHEFGHWTRARQVGGEFVFEKISIPWPDARMDLPEDIDLFSETLTSVGGFEINNLMHRMIGDRYYAKGYGFANLGVHSFIQQIYYPAYAFIVAPLVNGKRQDPEDPDIWIHTMGDPVESTLLVYRNYSGAAIPEAGMPVDPWLVNYYRECKWMSLLWTALNPGIYEGVRAFGAPMERNGGYMEPRMLGNFRFSWMYGTLFNASPLGYELYLDQHVRINGQYLRCSLRYGRPFQNYGIEISMPEIYKDKNVILGADAAYWYQEMFGHGIRIGGNGEIRFRGLPGIMLAGGWKSEGYVLGMPVEQTAYIRGGLNFYCSRKE